MKSAGRWPLIAWALISTLVASSCTRDSPLPDATDDRSEAETTPTADIVLQAGVSSRTITFRIPTSYLARGTDRQEAPREFVEIETGLPDLGPHPFDVDVRGTDVSKADPAALQNLNNALFIRLTALPDPTTRTSDFDFAALRQRWLATPYIAKADLDAHDLMRFSEVQCGAEPARIMDPARCTASNNLLFIHRPGEQPAIWMSCVQVSGFRDACTAHAFCKDLGVAFMFRRTQLARWRDFHAATCELISRFRVDG